MRNGLIKLAGLTLVLLITAFTPAQSAQGCVHLCALIECTPPLHCCVVGIGACATCTTAPCQILGNERGPS
jgi:hypothetical protein